MQTPNTKTPKTKTPILLCFPLLPCPGSHPPPSSPTPCPLSATPRPPPVPLATDIGAMRLAGLAGLVGGALSMAAGEYISVSSQRDTEEVGASRHEHQALLWCEITNPPIVMRKRRKKRRRGADATMDATMATIMVLVMVVVVGGDGGGGDAPFTCRPMISHARAWLQLGTCSPGRLPVHHRLCTSRPFLPLLLALP